MVNHRFISPELGINSINKYTQYSLTNNTTRHIFYFLSILFHFSFSISASIQKKCTFKIAFLSLLFRFSFVYDSSMSRLRTKERRRNSITKTKEKRRRYDSFLGGYRLISFARLCNGASALYFPRE